MTYNRHITIPDFVLKLDDTNEIIILLVKILGYQSHEVNIKDLIKDYQIKREEIKLLVSKGYLKIKDINGEIYVDIMPIYNFSKTKTEFSVISINDVEQFSFILGREIKQFELEILNKFVDEGFTIKEIQTAIQKSLLNNVDNFSYIEAVLKNNKKTPQVDSNNVKRNVDIY